MTTSAKKSCKLWSICIVGVFAFLFKILASPKKMCLVKFQIWGSKFKLFSYKYNLFQLLLQYCYCSVQYEVLLCVLWKQLYSHIFFLEHSVYMIVIFTLILQLFPLLIHRRKLQVVSCRIFNFRHMDCFQDFSVQWSLLIQLTSFTGVFCFVSAGTPYAGGSFRMKLVLGKSFPSEPPKAFFLTKIFHPNVATNGEICVNTLKKDWKPELGIKHILLVMFFICTVQMFGYCIWGLIKQCTVREKAFIL